MRTEKEIMEHLGPKNNLDNTERLSLIQWIQIKLDNSKISNKLDRSRSILNLTNIFDSIF